jgi:hypothetical protein
LKTISKNAGGSELHKSNIYGGAAIAKHRHQTTGNARVMWLVESSFTLFPTSGGVYVCRTPKEAYNPECLDPTVKHGGCSVTDWAAISWYSVVGPIITLLGRITTREYVDMLGNQVHPMIQMLF